MKTTRFVIKGQLQKEYFLIGHDTKDRRKASYREQSRVNLDLWSLAGGQKYLHTLINTFYLPYQLGIFLSICPSQNNACDRSYYSCYYLYITRRGYFYRTGRWNVVAGSQVSRCAGMSVTREGPRGSLMMMYTIEEIQLDPMQLIPSWEMMMCSHVLKYCMVRYLRYLVAAN